MLVRDSLRILGEKIRDVYPKMAAANSANEADKRSLRAFIADIQQRFAEVYAIIQRETANDDLDLNYAQAVAKYPERLHSITNLISILALAIKTKLNVPDFQEVFNREHARRIDEVCFECYKIKTLLGATGPVNAQAYSEGIRSSLRYSDYKTGYTRSIAPGIVRGQLMAGHICTPTTMSTYTSMITSAREELDQEFNVPAIDVDGYLMPRKNGEHLTYV